MKYSVGAVARILGITPGALHYYEREGLIESAREENGRRYYDDAAMWRLLSYEKYHSMEYPIKTVIDQFTGGGTRALIEARVRDRRDEAIRKSEYYRLLALSIEDHIDGQARIDELLDNYAFERSEALFFWHADDGWMSEDPAQQDIAARFIGAMPAMQIGVCLDAPGETRFGYAIKRTLSEKIGFEIPPGTRYCEPRSCLRSVVRCGHEFVYNPEIAFEAPLAYAKSRGLKVVCPAGARILLVETLPPDLFRAYIDVWIPIQ